MGKRANVLEIMDMDDIFNDYIGNLDYMRMGKMGDNMFLSLKNRLLEQKVEKLQEELEAMREKLGGLEEEK